MAKRADILALVGVALEVGAAVALWFCYSLRHLIDLGVILLVASGCLFSLGICAFLYASLAAVSSTRGEEKAG